MAKRFGVDPDLFVRLIERESGFDPEARGSFGEVGLSQVMEETALAPGFGVAPLVNRHDPVDNLRFGAEYLGALIRHYDGDVSKALMAYNGGAGNVARGTVSDAAREYSSALLPSGYRSYDSSSGEKQATGVADESVQELAIPLDPAAPAVTGQTAPAVTGQTAPAVTATGQSSSGVSADAKELNEGIRELLESKKGRLTARDGERPLGGRIGRKGEMSPLNGLSVAGIDLIRTYSTPGGIGNL